jgi:hypothetical protein
MFEMDISREEARMKSPAKMESISTTAVLSLLASSKGREFESL